MLDFTGPIIVEVDIRDDGKVVWINVNGACAMRACQVKQVIVNDHRKTWWEKTCQQLLSKLVRAR